MSNQSEQLSNLNPLRSQRRNWIVVAILFFMALSIRLYGIHDMSLWMDELRQINYYYAEDFKSVMYGAASQQQLPLDYWIGHAIFKYWQSETAARMPAAIFSSLVVACTYWLARRVASRPMALWAAAMVLCWPYGIYYGQEARPYAIFWFFLMLSVVLLVRAWERNRWRDWLLLYPALLCCVMSRTLAPMTITAGMGVWALLSLVGNYRRHRKMFFRQFLTWRGTRLLVCLMSVWIPAAYLISYIISLSKRFLSTSYDVPFRPNLPWAILKDTMLAMTKVTFPYWLIVLPAGIAGFYLISRKRAGDEKADKRVIFLPVIIGLIIHIAVYCFAVVLPPKPVYWAYCVPFLFIGATYVLQRAGEWCSKNRISKPGIAAAWSLMMILAAVQLSVDRQTLIMRKRDWRGVAQTVQQLGSHDVIFFSVNGVFQDEKPAFMAQTLYMPDCRRVVTLHHYLPAALLNDGQPILNARHCRVGLILLCREADDPEQLLIRLSSDSRQAFDFIPFYQFLVCVSRDTWPTADEGLLALSNAVFDLFGEENPRLVDFHIARSIVYSKTGQTQNALQETGLARSLTSESLRSQLDEVFRQLGVTGSEL